MEKNLKKYIYIHTHTHTHTHGHIHTHTHITLNHSAIHLKPTTVNQLYFHKFFKNCKHTKSHVQNVQHGDYNTEL